MNGVQEDSNLQSSISGFYRNIYKRIPSNNRNPMHLNNLIKNIFFILEFSGMYLPHQVTVFNKTLVTISLSLNNADMKIGYHLFYKKGFNF